MSIIVRFILRSLTMYLSEKINDKINYLSKLYYLINNEDLGHDKIISFSLHHGLMFTLSSDRGSRFYEKPFGEGCLNEVLIESSNDIVSGFRVVGSQHKKLSEEISVYEGESQDLPSYRSDNVTEHERWVSENGSLNSSAEYTSLSISKKGWQALMPFTTLDAKGEYVLSEKAVSMIDNSLDFCIYLFSRKHLGIGIYEVEADGSCHVVRLK